MRIAGLMMALAMAGASQAQTTLSKFEEMHLYPERLAGQTITVEGMLSGAEKDGATVQVDFGRVGKKPLSIRWAERDALWERAQLTCIKFPAGNECKVKVTGTLKEFEVLKGEYFIDRATVEFLKSPK